MPEPTLLQVLPISDLLGEKFFVPSYQRGYRWTKVQVEELLNDIWEFRKSSEAGPKDQFYCLQPLVVMRQGWEWVLIDGQQRLTTIYLILKYLEQILVLFGKEKYSIRYETRPSSEQYLLTLSRDERNRNVDYFHIYEAYCAIDKWFNAHDGTARVNFLTTLINDDEAGKNVKVIWYEIPGSVDPIEVFTRINIGKIPLTNAELIKSLFLGSIKDHAMSEDDIQLKRLQIASEWDTIEYTLQNDSFWYFIYEGKHQYETRIEFIFDLIQSKADQDDPEEYFTFHRFYEELKKTDDVISAWSEIKKYFQTFYDWYNNQVLYHRIGFLVATGYPISNIVSAARKITKSQFHDFLVKQISRQLPENIEDLEYGNRNRDIKLILLLFNIQTIISNPKSTLRFPFNDYKREKGWDIEHIRSVKSDKPLGNTQRPFLKTVLEYFIGPYDANEQGSIIDELKSTERKLVLEIKTVLDKEKILTDEFDKLYDKVLTYFKEDKEPEEINSIWNLTLLDSATNRGYRNVPFPIKRKTILNNDRHGTFVPICTKNVFLKAYSKKIDDSMFWKENDGKDYVNEINSCFSIYYKS